MSVGSGACPNGEPEELQMPVIDSHSVERDGHEGEREEEEQGGWGYVGGH